MEKTLHLTLTLYGEQAEIYSLEPESGSDYTQRFHFASDMKSTDVKDAINQIGAEILSWFPLMADELAEQEEGSC